LDIKIKSALISVSDKSGLDVVVKKLHEQSVKLISTGGTAQFISDMNIPVIDVSEVTKFPEMMGGRVKTLHPNIHGGLLAARDNRDHTASQDQYNIEDIDLLIVNLYPFENTVNSKANKDECIENIDIGGPAMIRAAAKNHEFVTILTDPGDYSKLINELKDECETSYAFRKHLAGKAFKLTNEYDHAISDWFNNENINAIDLPQKFSIDFKKFLEMRYGENPHQKAAFYKTNDPRIGIATSNQLQGKELSYNNINDGNAAYELICEFNQPAIAIIKHANPCGVAENANINLAWEKALQTDPISAFGGIVALNRELTLDLAKQMKSLFLEVIIAPSFTKEALQIFRDKPNVRILASGSMPIPQENGLDIKSISGGMLVQTRDNKVLQTSDLKIVTKRVPTQLEINNLLFAWKVAKHTKSNAIIYAKDLQTVGIGAGQMSRIDSTMIANEKAKKSSILANLKSSMTFESVVASDAFFPFADGLVAAADAGVTAVIQPGGSIRDQEVIAAADERNIAMVFTSVRHFKH
jgi:phosphoribosylaminoimidazolecarboxamide formyltransferase/IMP cyclohydrolase